MKNKKGFTLIELLAVIVILGVIMVIAVPAITKYIDNSRKEGFTKTASGVVDAARLYYSNEYGQSSESTIEFECTTKECKSTSGEKLELTKSPDKGTVKIFNDGEIIACFQRNTWYAVKNINDNEVTFGEGKCEYNEESNSYDTIELVSREMVDDLQDELNDVREELTLLKSKGDATKEEILESKKAVVKGTEITGTMPNKGTLSQSLTAGASLTLAPGYYNGGTITSNTLESQTTGTAASTDIANGKVAWVNGNKVTGSYIQQSTAVILGTSAGTYNIKNLYPSTYQDFTINNFLIESPATTYESYSDLLRQCGNSTGHIYHGRTIMPSKSYNATTGVLTVSNGLNDCLLYYNDGATLGGGGSNTNGTGKVIAVNKVVLIP